MAEFEIILSPSDSPDIANGQIKCNGMEESFQASTRSFSIDRYIAQWRNAISASANNREPSALFSSINLNERGWGYLWMYMLIPAELQGKSTEKGASFINIYQRFMPVTTRPRLFLERIYLELENGTTGPEIALYFLDIAHPERFYRYLTFDNPNASCWQNTTASMQKFLTAEAK